MEVSDIEKEIEKLKMRRVEIVNRINTTHDFDEKEDLRLQASAIQKQIDALERFKRK